MIRGGLCCRGVVLFVSGDEARLVPARCVDVEEIDACSGEVRLAGSDDPMCRVCQLCCYLTGVVGSSQSGS